MAFFGQKSRSRRPNYLASPRLFLIAYATDRGSQSHQQCQAAAGGEDGARSTRSAASRRRPSPSCRTSTRPSPPRSTLAPAPSSGLLRRDGRGRGVRGAGAGRPEAAVRSLRVALASCPPEKTAAVAKVRSMLAIASAQLHKQQHQAQLSRK